MGSQFMLFYRTVRNSLKDAMEHEWILHTTLGPMSFSRIEWNDEAGVLLFHCFDQDGQYRFLAFTDRQLASFPIEVKKVDSSKGQRSKIGFETNEPGENVTALSD